MDVNSDIDPLSEVDLSCYDISGVDSNDCTKSSESELELQPAGKNKSNRKISGVTYIQYTKKIYLTNCFIYEKKIPIEIPTAKFFELLRKKSF